MKKVVRVVEIIRAIINQMIVDVCNPGLQELNGQLGLLERVD